MGGREEGFSGTTIKHTWTKPKVVEAREGRMAWVGRVGAGGSKCRQL